MKIVITGDAYVLTSDITVEDIKTLSKSNPNALLVVDKETKAEKFAISYSEGKPSVTQFGIVFGGSTRDDDKKATVTGMIPTGTKDAKAYVADLLGVAVVYLKELEETVPAAAAKIINARKTLIDDITVA